MLKIQGLGPKSIRALWEQHRISTIDGLETLCREHKLQELPRMGAKLEEKVLRSIAAYRQRAGRFLLSFAQEVADELTAYLSKVPGVETVTPAGSLRRGKETVGDLDLLAAGPGAEAAIETFVAHPKVHEVLGKGPNKASVKFGSGRLAGGSARASQGKLRRGPAILHRKQGAQRGAAGTGA